jgi:hypothetical protein
MVRMKMMGVKMVKAMMAAMMSMAVTSKSRKGD